MALVHPLKKAVSHNLTIYSGCPDEIKAYGKHNSEISWTSITLDELLIAVQTCSNNWFKKIFSKKENEFNFAEQ